MSASQAPLVSFEEFASIFRAYVAHKSGADVLEAICYEVYIDGIFADGIFADGHTSCLETCAALERRISQLVDAARSDEELRKKYAAMHRAALHYASRDYLHTAYVDFLGVCASSV